MEYFKVKKNIFLDKDIYAYCHTDYYNYHYPNNPDFIVELKNTFNNKSDSILLNSTKQLYIILSVDIPNFIATLRSTIPSLNQNKYFTICTVPRSKKEDFYSSKQLLFRQTVSNFARSIEGLIDGTSFIIRHTNTKTTHIRKFNPFFNNDGELPRRGLAKDTCYFSNELIGQDIILIDDVYTESVGVDEDMIQALLDKGAENVFFYAIGKTVSKY